MDNVLKPSAQLLIKLGSLIVHYQELNSPNGHIFDKSAIETLENDNEVMEWLTQMDELALVPKKRN